MSKKGTKSDSNPNRFGWADSDVVFKDSSGRELSLDDIRELQSHAAEIRKDIDARERESRKRGR